MLIGSKKKVYYSTEPMRTSGGLRREDLILNKRGRVVSKKRSELAKANYKLKNFQYKSNKDATSGKTTETN